MSSESSSLLSDEAKALFEPAERHFMERVEEVVEKSKLKTFASWYEANGSVSHERTFGQVWEEAGRISYYIHKKWNLKKGDRVILCYDFGLHFFEVFLGCLRAGVTAVLVYPPGPPLASSLSKLMNVVRDCQPSLILTDTRVNRGRLLDTHNPFSETKGMWPTEVAFEVTDKLSRRRVQPYDETTAPTDLAFLQYTSGSTGEPKGVMITFQALTSNVSVLHHNCYHWFPKDIGNDWVGFSWLPQYHDLGLIAAMIAPFVGGWRMHMMSPITFIQDPLLWIELMSKHKVKWSVAPDFAYSLVARKAPGDKRLPSVDLSNLDGLISAAEPNRQHTKLAFEQALKPYGLKADAWYCAAFGLAENVVGVTHHRGYDLSVPRDEDDGKSYISCGHKSEKYHSILVKIVNPETCEEVEGDNTGELWIAGPSKAAGYYGQPELSKDTFEGKLKGYPEDVTFLRTGDLAFYQNDHLFICGRIKDLIIFNGANYYPHDVELVAQDASPLIVRPGCVAAFSSGQMEDDFMLDIVFEIRNESADYADEVCTAIRQAVSDQIGLPVHRVVAIKERTIPKTTSGKIRRRATQQALFNNELEIVNG